MTLREIYEREAFGARVSRPTLCKILDVLRRESLDWTI